MRELKFRAWDVEKKIYGQVTLIEWCISEYEQQKNYGHKGRVSLWNVKNEADCGSWGRWIERVELEQFTGLKDKNGREIYEGDVVRTSYKFSNNVPENRMAVVEWDICNPCFVLHWINEKRTDGYEYDFVKAGMMSLKVIGNIHENPELVAQ